MLLSKDRARVDGTGEIAISRESFGYFGKEGTNIFARALSLASLRLVHFIH